MGNTSDPPMLLSRATAKPLQLRVRRAKCGLESRGGKAQVPSAPQINSLSYAENSLAGVVGHPDRVLHGC